MAVILENVTYKYDLDDNASEEFGIFDIVMKVEDGTTAGIIGKTGSGPLSASKRQVDSRGFYSR